MMMAVMIINIIKIINVTVTITLVVKAQQGCHSWLNNYNQDNPVHRDHHDHDHQVGQYHHDHDHLSQRLLSSAGFPLAPRSRARRVSGSFANVPKVTLNCHDDDDDHKNDPENYNIIIFFRMMRMIISR